MKTRTIWELSDIESGLYIIRDSSTIGSKDLSFACTVCYKIGFIAGVQGQPYALISMMTDGMVFKTGTKEDILKRLNEDEEGYRPLTKAEYLRIIRSTNQGFKK